jgi:hypothetical protein
MNTEALFLFLILLLGLLLCSFLGGNCGREGFSGKFSGTFNLDGNGVQSSSGVSTTSQNQYDNYNHYTGSSTQLSSGTTFYGESGRTAVVISDKDGNQSLQIILPGSTTPVTFAPEIKSSQEVISDSEQTKVKSPSLSNIESYINYGEATSYYGPNGATATIVKTDNGQQAVKVTTPSGSYYYNSSGTPITPNSSTQYYGSTGYTIQIAPYSMAYQEPPTVSTNSKSQGTGISDAYSSGGYSSDYYSTLPGGIPKSKIPPGQEDLYILKSQVVPPVCPACPSSAACPRQEPCPPCPACARCPEPSFECKKVPNYRAGSRSSSDNGSTYNNSSKWDNSGSTYNNSSKYNSGSKYNNSSSYNNGSSYNSMNNNPAYSSSKNEFLPIPVLNDFSTFGM